MGKLGYKGLLLLGGMMMLGGAAQAQYLRSSYFMEGTSYNPQIQISAESETKRSKKESAQHSKSRNKSFVMTSVSAL